MSAVSPITAHVVRMAIIAFGALFGWHAHATLPPVDRIAFEPNVGASLPLDARFVDEHRRAVHFGDYFANRPVIVVLGYYGCSNLCSVVLQGLAHSLAVTDLHPGRDVEIVVASIAPLETPDMALDKKLSVVANADQAGWHFLTGEQSAIDRLANALGYRYAYDEGERQYAHAAGIVVATPDGRVAQTLYGVVFAADALKQALRHSKLQALSASPSDSKWLLCFHYDPQNGRYSFVAMSAARLAALGALVLLGGFVIRATRSR